ncbi:MAG: DNA/RNA nuclease SfsA [Alphaproteobacteria bacterium]|nr:DNA/RNA nuclease SfsA [Alphaproteobacteria bacterium]OJV46464.1 MAG: sugar fermentation stimulation protein SfsA [Alphaproteobacteria bacterium 43-37]
MKFLSPLIPGTLIKRYKRFLADVTLSLSEIVTVHCPNPGAMTGLTAPGNKVWLSLSANPHRKLKYTLEMIEAEGTIVGVNTLHPNKIVHEALSSKMIPELAHYETFACEVAYDQNSRIDWLATHHSYPPCYVEVKNVHLKIGTGAQFPDAVTTRGTKHLQALSRLAEQKQARAILIYIIQRNDIDHFSLASHIDPTYAKMAALSHSLGVEMYAYCCNVTQSEISLSHRIPIID